VSAEDIAAHLGEIEDLDGFSVPASVWEELRGLGAILGGRDGDGTPSET
jgi:hypothetical protein